MAQISQPRPDSGIGFQTKVLVFEISSISLGSGPPLVSPLELRAPLPSEEGTT